MRKRRETEEGGRGRGDRERGREERERERERRPGEGREGGRGRHGGEGKRDGRGDGATCRADPFRAVHASPLTPFHHHQPPPHTHIHPRKRAHSPAYTHMNPHNHRSQVHTERNTSSIHADNINFSVPFPEFRSAACFLPSSTVTVKQLSRG